VLPFYLVVLPLSEYNNSVYKKDCITFDDHTSVDDTFVHNSFADNIVVDNTFVDNTFVSDQQVLYHFFNKFIKFWIL
jgi:hypothetical protein